MATVRKSLAFRRLSTILKIMIVAFVIGVNILIIWRMASSGDPKEIRTLMVNDATLKAYLDPEVPFEGYYQEQNTITRTKEAYGYFSVTQVVILPSAHQVQIVFRYNRSTVKHLQQDYGLEEMPSFDEDLYDVTLVLTEDLTPEDRGDNQDPQTIKLMRYYPSEVKKEQKSVYQYRRLVFDQVDITEDTIGAFVDVYYNRDIRYEESAYGTLCIYDDESERKTYVFSKRDMAALNAAADQNAD
ncbi:MAG: hypothetical protein IJU20_05005 [Clostridia bacterium]|nr:hypothetical protein [Clostridia bacterium]